MLGGILLLTVLCAAWVGVRGFLAYGHLTNARAAAADATSVLSDPALAPRLISDVSSATSAARDLTSDVVWSAAEHLPWVGPQLAAVSSVAQAADDVASQALAPLSSVASSFSVDSIRPKDGAIDLAPFANLEDAARKSASGLGAANANVAAIDTAPLLGPVREAVAEFGELLAQAYTAADALKRTAILLPPMLGADEPRDYLVVFQNNAEWRSLGGIVGAMALIHTDHGQISLVTQASASSDFRAYGEPVVPLTDEERRLFGSQPATYAQNVTQIPDFTRGAAIIQEMWQRNTGTTIDGVLSLDPVALSYVLDATGPVSLSTGETLTSENAVQLLLNEVYLKYEDPAVQDAFFASVASTVFEKISSGDLKPAAFVSALGRAGAEHRLMLWNSDEDEQAVLDGTTLQGAYSTPDADTTDFGLFLNDATGAKLDYYAQVDTEIAWCSAQEAGLTVTLRNGAPADAASFPSYMTANGNYGVDPGDLKTVAYIYLPEDSTLLSSEATGTGRSPGLGGGTDAGRQVLTWTTTLSPGQEMTLDVRVKTPSMNPIVIQTTPTIHAQSAPALAPSCSSPE